ncbi:MAG: hypothetical protein IH623_01095 [Verrucomicrobia bacterium]|nr:hypothetical protein [Verrucomicrobiota bacterium]
MKRQQVRGKLSQIIPETTELKAEFKRALVDSHNGIKCPPLARSELQLKAATLVLELDVERFRHV